MGWLKLLWLLPQGGPGHAQLGFVRLKTVEDLSLVSFVKRFVTALLKSASSTSCRAVIRVIPLVIFTSHDP